MSSEPLIAGVADTANSLVNFGLNQINSSRDFRRTKSLMALQNDYNIQNWQMNNEYNSPSNQIARLRSAGINPDLFYGGSGNLVASSIPSESLGSSPISHPATFGSGNFGASLLLDSQKKLLDAQTEKTLADANQTNQLTPWVTEEIKSRLSLNDSNAKVLNENVEKIRNETELLKWQNNIAKNESQISDALKDSRISEELKRLGASETQSDEIIKSFSKLYSAQIQLAIAQSYASYVQSDAARENASTNRYNAETSRASLQLDSIIRHGELNVKKLNYELEKELNRFGMDVTSVQNEWRTMLKDVPIIGDAVHGLLSIPGSFFGGVSHIMRR